MPGTGGPSSFVPYPITSGYQPPAQTYPPQFSGYPPHNMYQPNTPSYPPMPPVSLQMKQELLFM